MTSAIGHLSRHIVNLLGIVAPTSAMFRLKVCLLNISGMKICHNVKINGHTWFYGRGYVEIRKNSWIGPRCRFYTNESVTITIGKNCDIAPEVAFVTGSHEVGDKNRRAGKGFCKGITIEDGCWVGAGVTILGGVSIGKGSVIGAGALVNKSIPAGCIAVGVPAKLIKCLGD